MKGLFKLGLLAVLASGCLSAQVDLVILHGDGPNGPSDDAVTPYLDASADATETRLRVVYTLATGEVLGSISIALEEQNLVTVAADGTPTYNNDGPLDVANSATALNTEDMYCELVLRPQQLDLLTLVGEWTFALTLDGSQTPDVSLTATPYRYKNCASWTVTAAADAEDECMYNLVAKCDDTIYPLPYAALAGFYSTVDEAYTEDTATLKTLDDFKQTAGDDGTISLELTSNNAATINIGPLTPKNLVPRLEVWLGADDSITAANLENGFEDPRVLDRDVAPVDGVLDEFDYVGCQDWTSYCDAPSATPQPLLPQNTQLGANVICQLGYDTAADTDPAGGICRTEEIKPKTGQQLEVTLACAAGCVTTFSAADGTAPTVDIETKKIVCKANSLGWEEDDTGDAVGFWPSCDCGSGSSAVSFSLASLSLTVIAKWIL